YRTAPCGPHAGAGFRLKLVERFSVDKQRRITILVRQGQLLRFHTPVYFQVRIIEANRPFVWLGIRIRYLVKYLGVGNQGDKSMRVAAWHQYLVPSVCRNLERQPFPIGGRTLADIDDNIANGAARDA